MKKALRSIALVLALFLVCGSILTAAHADVVTLGIYFCGIRPGADGTDVTVKLEGRFRVLVNGEEAGIIEAGKNTLTLDSAERIRIEPLPESIAPEWDLSTAWCEVTPEAGGTTTVPVIVYPAKEGDTVVPTAIPAAEENADEPENTEPESTEPEGPEAGETEEEEPADGENAAEEQEAQEDEEPVMNAAGAAPTPTLPPFDASVLAPTPAPDFITLDNGSGTVRAMAYFDQNSTGLYEEVETTISGVTVCLMTEKGEAVAAVTTEKDGLAVFENLPEGKYQIKAILPDGWAFCKKNGAKEDYASVFGASIEGEAVSDAFSVKAGETAAPGISLTKCLHVSGWCWFETYADGLLKDGEPMLPGVRIEMNGVKNGLHYETISGEDGSWRIDRVKPAFYDLTVYAPDGMMFARVSNRGGKRSIITKDGVGKASRRMDLNDNESKENQYIGFTWAGEISGRCFLDANYNGVYDEGELPMAKVKITAIKQQKDEEIAVTYSGEDGTFTLTGLRGNTYKMRAVLPEDGSDFSKTVSDPLGNHFKARPGRRENFWPNFVLAEAEHKEMNVGVIYPGSITGTVYMDDDFSATKNGKEKIVSGFLVTLLDENGAVAATDKTSVKGKYELTGLVPGNYSLSVTAVKDYAFTRLGEGNVILNRTNGEGYSETFFLALGENKTGMDIGMIRPGTVEGAVFADANDNGLWDEGEGGMAGTVVRLMSDEGEMFRAEVGGDGKYLFDAVMPGNYYLEYQLPEGAVFARSKDGGNTISGENGLGKSERFDFTTGAYVQGPVCGALTLGSLAGMAYRDHDGDGLRSEGEEPLAGMTVTLTPGRAELEEISVTTGEDGSFELTDLRPDTWTLTVTCPEGQVLSRTDHISLPLTAGRNSQAVSLPVAMGAVWTGEELGAVIPAGLVGQLWMDENNNGLFDEGETTPAGYEIVVTDDLTGRVFDTLRTDEDGRYATSGMIPGSFTVSYQMDAETIAPKAGDSVFTEENGRLVVHGIQLKEDETREGLLIGIVRYTTIAGSVWIDRGDRVEALAGAEITLTDEEGSELMTAVTGENGEYRFERLMPGKYRLEASMPEGCVIIEPDDPRLTGDQISVITESTNREGSSEIIDLQMAEDRRRMNIGCVLPGRLGDYCWLDVDGDGLQGMNEEGIPGVKIELMRDGETIMETVTDQYGFYRFEDLYPAVYTLKVTPPAEVMPTKRRTDIRLIASVLEETEEAVCYSVDVQVESDKANYNADLGFICRREGVMPAGIGEGKKQNWSKETESE